MGVGDPMKKVRAVAWSAAYCWACACVLALPPSSLALLPDSPVVYLLALHERGPRQKVVAL